MNNFKDIVLKHKNKIIIAIIISIFIIMCIIFYCHHKVIHMIEGLTTSGIDSFSGKTVNFIYTSPTGILYLGLLPLASCGGAVKSIKECAYNIAVLQPTINSYCAFNIFKNIGSTTQYNIRSAATNMHPPFPHLSQNLNITSGLPLMCFDSGPLANITTTFTAVTGGYYIQFTKGTTTYYLGICTAAPAVCTSTAGTYKRLCLSTNKATAIVFNIVVQPTAQTTGVRSLEGEVHHEQETKPMQKIHTEYKPHTEHFGDISLYSIGDNSTDTMVSLPGIGNNDSYKIWTAQ